MYIRNIFNNLFLNQYTLFVRVASKKFQQEDDHIFIHAHTHKVYSVVVVVTHKRISCSAYCYIYKCILYTHICSRRRKSEKERE